MNNKLENENNRLKVNIIDLNDHVGKTGKRAKQLEADLKSERDAVQGLQREVQQLKDKASLGQREAEMVSLETRLRGIIKQLDGVN